MSSAPDEAPLSAASTGAFVPGVDCRVAGTGAGALTGLGFAVKDLIDVAGCVTGGGNPDWAAGQKPASCSAPVVQMLLDAGASVIAKTITDELAFSLEGENAHYGTPLNPRCPERLPGGSSSGSAAAVAAGLGDFALGTDTGGSVRVPASFCGLYGFRPTHGRVPTDGVIPFAPSYDTVGWLARSADILAQVGQTLLASGQDRSGRLRASSAARPDESGQQQARPHGGAPRPVIAEDAMAMADPRCAALLREAAAGLGARESVQVFGGDPESWLNAYQTLQGFEIWQSLGTWIRQRKPRFGANIGPRFAAARAIAEADAAASLTVRQTIRSRLAALLGDGRALLIPTTPALPLHKAAGAVERGEFYRVALTLNAIAGHGGLPQVTLPYAELDGCPLGLSIVGPAGSDEMLLSWARRLARNPSRVTD